MNAALEKFGAFIARWRWFVVAFWIVVLVGVVVFRQNSGGEFVNDYTVPNSQSSQGSDVLDSQYKQLSGNSGQIVFHNPAGSLTAYAGVINQSVASFAKLPHVVNATSPFAQANSPLVSEDKSIAYANVSFDVVPTTLDDSYLEQMDTSVKPARDAGLQVEYGGGAGQVASASSDIKSEVLGISAALVLLVIMFGSFLAAMTPLVSAVFSVITGLSILGLLAAVVQLPTTAPTIATLLGLGVAIDYGLFLVARHREQLDDGMDLRESIAKSESTSGASIIIAGGTVVIAILGLYISGVPFVGAMGAGAAIVVAVTMLAALTLVPAILAIVKGTIGSLKARRKKIKATKQSIAANHAKHEQSLFARWGRRVSNQPWPWGIGATVVLVVMTIPFFSIQLGQLDAGTNPTDQSIRRAYDLVEEGFGPGANGTLTVVMELPQQSPQKNKALIQSLETKVAQTPGVASVFPPSVNPAGTVAVLTATPTTSPQDEATTDLANDLRDNVLPSVPATTYITGFTAGNIDFTQKVVERLPWLIAAVVALSFILLMVAFRSILIPTKAAVMNLLSVGAAYGIIVAIFQWGWGLGFLGVNETVPIPSYVPMLMFAIVFGLSMDYEVFLLSRVREAFTATKDARRAVAIGIGSTARTITTAAAIMVVVFTSFVLNPDVSIKMMAIGMASAVLIDSTIVRMILVPSVMSLLGKRAWWIPRRLGRILPNLKLED